MPEPAKVAAVRSLLPATGAGIYLNAGAAGPMSTETQRAIDEQAQRELTTGRGHPDLAIETLERVNEARAAVAAVLVADPDAITINHGDGRRPARRARRDRMAGGRPRPHDGARGARARPPARTTSATTRGWRSTSSTSAAATTVTAGRAMTAVVAAFDGGTRAPGARDRREPRPADDRRRPAAPADRRARPRCGCERPRRRVAGRRRDPGVRRRPGRRRLRRPGVDLAARAGGHGRRLATGGSRTGDGRRPSSTGRRSSGSRGPAGGCRCTSACRGRRSGRPGWPPRRSTGSHDPRRDHADPARADGDARLVPDRGLDGRAAPGTSSRRRVFAILADVAALDALRISVGFWATEEELDRFADAVELLARHTPSTLPAAADADDPGQR